MGFLPKQSELESCLQNRVSETSQRHEGEQKKKILLYAQERFGVWSHKFQTSRIFVQAGSEVNT